MPHEGSFGRPASVTVCNKLCSVDIRLANLFCFDYRRSGDFHVKYNLAKKISVVLNFHSFIRFANFFND